MKTTGSIIIGEPLLIPFLSSLQTTGPATIEGSLTNQGLFDLGGDRHLTIIGTFIAIIIILVDTLIYIKYLETSSNN